MPSDKLDSSLSIILDTPLPGWEEKLLEESMMKTQLPSPIDLNVTIRANYIIRDNIKTGGNGFVKVSTTLSENCWSYSFLQASCNVTQEGATPEGVLKRM